MSDTLTHPTWPGGPPICERDNLPAFPTRQQALAFNARHPACRIQRLWNCDFCDHWHYLSKTRPPSGDSSGSSRR